MNEAAKHTMTVASESGLLLNAKMRQQQEKGWRKTRNWSKRNRQRQRKGRGTIRNYFLLKYLDPASWYTPKEAFLERAKSVSDEKVKKIDGDF